MDAAGLTIPAFDLPRLFTGAEGSFGNPVVGAPPEAADAAAGRPSTEDRTIAPAREGDLADRTLLQEALFSLEIEYQSIRLIQSQTGETYFERSSLKMKAVGAYRRVAALPFAPRPAKANGMYSFLLDYYSPENAAKRIADYAIGQFEGSADPSSEEGRIERSAYRDRMLAAVQRGADEARRLMSGMPIEILGIADQVEHLVTELFDRFVETGQHPAARHPATSGKRPPASPDVVGEFFVGQVSFEARVDRIALASPVSAPAEVDLTA